ncbi:MAG TPA: AAA domain-containing protein, partial [Acidimicrobiales bacterium]|nr:AAA domain-containing protein [Acidimicrobiales bacterium]
MEPAVILRYMADLAGATASSNTGLPGGPPPETVDLTRTREPAEWLGTSVALPLAPPGIAVEGQAGPPSIRFTPTVAHLSMLDALQPADHLLRLGWVVVAGRVIVEGRTLTCCFPLVSQPVRLTDPGFMRGTALLPAGAAELTPLVGDPSTAATLEAAAEYGGGALDPTHSQEAAGAGLIGRLPRLRSWIAAVVEACGLPPVTAVLPPSDDPLTHRTDDDLVAVVGAVLYAARDVFRPSAEGALRSWAAQEGTGATAFASLYSPDQPASDAAAGRDADGDPELGDHDDRPLLTPLRLSAAQADAVRRARRQPVSVISGPPGSGKSQAVAAIAADSVAHGGSVLVATRSEHAADVVTALLAREPGPDPVRFGGAHNDDIVRQATAPGASGRDVEAAHRALDEARARRRLAERAVTTLLDREEAAGRAT